MIHDDRIAIHTSDRRVFKRCRRKFYFASNLQRGLQPKKPNSIFWLGTGVHHALQMYYESNSSIDIVQSFDDWAMEERKRLRESGAVIWENDWEKMDENQQLGKDLLTHYSKWCKDKDTFKPYKMEVMFSIPIKDPDDGYELEVEHPVTKKKVPVTYDGRFDGIVIDPDGDYWVLEHKTAKSFSDWDDKLPMDEQVSSYVWAAQELFDVRVKGVIYNGIKKKVPTVPTVLKSGKGLSKNKAIDTTYDVYMQAILDNGFDPADYEDILTILKNKPNMFFRREYIYRDPAEIVQQQKQIFEEAVDMLTAQSFYPNPTRDCCWDCDFKEACSIVQARGDVEPYLELNYEARPDERDEFTESIGGED